MGKWIVVFLLIIVSLYVYKSMPKYNDRFDRAEKMVFDEKETLESCAERQFAQYQEAEKLIRKNVVVPAGCEGPHNKKNFRADFKNCSKFERVRSEESSLPRSANFNADLGMCHEFKEFTVFAENYRRTYDEADFIFLAELVGPPYKYKALRIFKAKNPKFTADQLVLDPPAYVHGRFWPVVEQMLVFAKWDKVKKKMELLSTGGTPLQYAFGLQEAHFYFPSDGSNSVDSERAKKMKSRLILGLEQILKFSGDGILAIHDLDGKIVFELSYQDHELNGTSRRYSPTGKVTEEIVFRDGQFQNAKRYDQSGISIEKECIKTSQGLQLRAPSTGQDGPESVYLDNGDIIQISKRLKDDSKYIDITYNNYSGPIYNETWHCKNGH